MLIGALAAMPVVASLVTGVVADAVGTAAAAPVEIVKRRLQVSVGA